MGTLHRVSDEEELVSSAALSFIDTVAALQSPGGGLHGDGVARVVLTGGGAGIGTLRELARLDQAALQQSEDYPALSIDWTRVHIFFGDERNVPVTDPDSNEGQARLALLNSVGVPERNIHGFDLGAIAMEAAAKAYSAEIAEFAPHGFDLHLLGMGPEGHINSLFPHSPAVREETELAVAVHDSPKPPAERITLTLPAVNSSDRIWLLVSGAAKAEAVKHVVDGSPAVDWPAAGAHGRKETVLYVSSDAASLL
ncbi:6-phosphogluconolactonase [Corynebacterium flavescens]|uniref:6-phosphogluconolactonase n=1 Tax=Corynebacterium flavescens TaxID=28028 RepID=A0A1L7CM50_CORFL|nr:6-phosphogluconolactonase [Corynebacterium flavescens]APT86898.1 6-phosphogluconolactonase [Corynebacterium flavescens]KAA8722090.1 6-phosphogluconolactonase [Corynebacterium flavescens]GEB98205.1 6-phosphogluconolactonase [Corynebacterium flavescens]